ncbi:MAG: sugar phosphate isomerase/epimerase family protein [Verrucomicrobiales bacterium]
MKKAISTWSFYGDWDLRRKMAIARDAGFAGFEPEFTEDGDLALDGDVSSWKKVRTLADEVGIELSGLATGLYWGANGASNDPVTRAKAAHILERQIHCAETIGVDTILVVPAAVGVDFIPECEVVPYDLAYERATDLIQNALSIARAAGVTIAVENVWNKFLLSPLEMKGFLEQFDDKHVGLYFDAGNVLATGYPEHWIRILSHHIKRVHFKDYRRNVGTADGFVDLLSGDIHWDQVIMALKEVGYKDWIAAEMIPPAPFYKHAPKVLIENTSRAMDAIFKL